MKLDTAGGLYRLIRQQYEEANEVLSRRLPKWAYLLDVWRGLSKGKDAYSRATEAQFWADTGLTPYELDLEDEEEERDAIVVREATKHVEVWLSRVDRAYWSHPNPFTLDPPRVYRGAPPTPQDIQHRRIILQGHTEYLTQEWRMRGYSEEGLEICRDVANFGVGYSYGYEHPKEPRAVFGRVFPWMVLTDPYNPHTWEGLFYMVKRWREVQDVIARYPDLKEEIKEFGETRQWDQREADTMSGTQTRRQVMIYEITGEYDPAALEGALLPEDLQNLGDPSKITMIVLGDAEGPSEYVLDAFPTVAGRGALIDWTILRDPADRGVGGYGISDLILDNHNLANILANRMLDAFEYATQGGGIINAKARSNLQEALSVRVRPSEYRVVDLPQGLTWDQALHEKASPDHTPEHLRMLAWNKAEGARQTGVQDFNTGSPMKTDSGTLGEMNNLGLQGDEMFRFRIARLDPSYRQAMEVHVLLSAVALRHEYELNPDAGPLIYRTAQDEMLPIDPSIFDEDWEMVLRCGTNWIDAKARSKQRLFWIDILTKMNEPFSALMAAREAMADDDMDPDSLGLPTPADVEQVKQMQMLMQLMRAGGGMPATPGGVIAPSSMREPTPSVRVFPQGGLAATPQAGGGEGGEPQ